MNNLVINHMSSVHIGKGLVGQAIPFIFLIYPRGQSLRNNPIFWSAPDSLPLNRAVEPGDQGRVSCHRSGLRDRCHARLLLIRFIVTITNQFNLK